MGSGAKATRDPRLEGLGIPVDARVHGFFGLPGPLRLPAASQTVPGVGAGPSGLFQGDLGWSEEILVVRDGPLRQEFSEYCLHRPRSERWEPLPERVDDGRYLVGLPQPQRLSFRPEHVPRAAAEDRFVAMRVACDQARRRVEHAKDLASSQVVYHGATPPAQKNGPAVFPLKPWSPGQVQPAPGVVAQSTVGGSAFPQWPSPPQAAPPLPSCSRLLLQSVQPPPRQLAQQGLHVVTPGCGDAGGGYPAVSFMGVQPPGNNVGGAAAQTANSHLYRG